jgi:PAS domain S-box-containing protein
LSKNEQKGNSEGKQAKAERGIEVSSDFIKSGLAKTHRSPCERTRKRAVSLRTSPLRNKCVSMTSRRIAGRGKMQEALQRSEERYRNLVESAPEVIYTISNDGIITSLNDTFEKLTGWSRPEWIGKSFESLIHPDDLPLAIQTLQDIVAGKALQPYELRVVSKSGRYLVGEFTSRPQVEDGKIVGEFGIVHDITERKNIEEKYRTISKKMESLMKSSAIMLRTNDVRKRLKTIAEAVREQGWGRVVITLRDENLNTTDIVSAGLTIREERYLREHQSSGNVWRKRLSSMFERYRLGEFYYLPWSDPHVQEQFKYALSSKVPKEKTVDWDPDDLLYIPLRLPTGQIVGIMSIDDPDDGRRPSVDSLAPLELFAHQAAVAIENAKLLQQLSDAKNQVEEYAEHLEEKVEKRTADLKRSEEKLRSILAASPDSITATDLNGNVIECNDQTVKIHGCSSKKELIGKSALAFISKKDHQRAIENLRKTLRQGVTRNVEYTFTTNDGREFPGEISASTVRDASGKPIGFVGVTKDITERKKMELQLLKSERLAAIGQLAAMVGHDLRNPLTGIVGAAYYLNTKFRRKLDSKGREMLDVIRKDIEHSNKIINDLLEYSRESKLELTESNPRSIIKEALSIVRVPKRVRIEDLSRNHPRIRVDVDKLKRAFANIIKNSVDAMSKGGTLTIRSRESRGNLEIVFADTGIGMNKDTIEKIFSPLFTTKARGMGLGLPICKRFVEAHGGKISVESTIAGGTTFTITIPSKVEMEGGEKGWIMGAESLSLTTTKA